MYSRSLHFWLFLICAIMLLVNVRAIRPLERDHRKNSMVSSEFFTKGLPISEALFHTEEEEEAVQGTGGEKGCEKNENAEECLNRRTLVAHTDYIYTQNHNGP